MKLDGDKHERHMNATATIEPRFLRKGEEFTLVLRGWTKFAGSVVEAHIGVTCPASYLSFRPLQAHLDADGNGTVVVPEGIDVDWLWSAYVDRVSGQDQTLLPWSNPASLVNWDGDSLTEEGAQLVHYSLSGQNKSLYGSPLGDSSNPLNRVHRVVTLLTGVLTTQHNIYPGLITIPLDKRPVDREHLELLNHFLGGLKLPVKIDAEKWFSSKANRHPTTAVLIPQIWAEDFDSAHLIASEAINRLQLVLSLNRLAAAKPVALVIEQRQPDETSLSRVYPFDTRYTGNLAGGFIAGESSEQLEAEFRGMQEHALARLAATLFSEALAEVNEDFAFFKYWACLEVLSEELGSNGALSLTDGSPWPDKVNPLDPGPKVYSMIASILLARSTHEQSFSAPGTDLYDLVQVLKARRNATAHYGGFDAGSQAQQSRPWYPHALRSSTSTFEWLGAARSLCVTALRFALSSSPQGH